MLRRQILSAACALSLSGCAALSGFLSEVPLIAAAFDDFGPVLKGISDWIDTYFTSHPNPTLKTKIDEALAKTEIGLQLAKSLAKAGSAFDQKKFDQAVADLTQAWDELETILQPIGLRVERPGSKAQAVEGGFVVAEPAIIRVGHARAAAK